MPTSKECAMIAARAADEKKATDIVIQEVGESLQLTDYFIIATGANARQVDAISEAVEEHLRLQAGIKPIGREGQDDLTWVLLDYGILVVHIFQPELRDFYRLDTLWSDSPTIDAIEAGIEAPEYSERVAKLLGRRAGQREQ
ncbi:MAG: ribosome silencing factor [Actinomycetia bacterium]|nr:ribosome silencing factor [Actinomycetes bacterium]